MAAKQAAGLGPRVKAFMDSPTGPRTVRAPRSCRRCCRCLPVVPCQCC